MLPQTALVKGKYYFPHVTCNQNNGHHYTLCWLWGVWVGESQSQVLLTRGIVWLPLKNILKSGTAKLQPQPPLKFCIPPNQDLSLALMAGGWLATVTDLLFFALLATCFPQRHRMLCVLKYTSAILILSLKREINKNRMWEANQLKTSTKQPQLHQATLNYERKGHLWLGILIFHWKSEQIFPLGVLIG